jgi:flagellar secretion chaperone FliS
MLWGDNMALVNGIYQPVRNLNNTTNNSLSSPGSENMMKAAANKNPYQQYQQNTINTSTPEDLTLMLYNGLVKFLKLGHQGIEEKDVPKSNNNLLKAQSIITEFMCTLDMKYEVSVGLMSLYEYMNRQLIEANIKKDKSIVEEILGYAEELRDTWTQAMKLAKQLQAVSK